MAILSHPVAYVEASLTSLYPPSPGPGKFTATDFLFLTILAPSTNRAASSATPAMLPTTIPAISLGSKLTPPETSNELVLATVLQTEELTTR